MTRSEESAKEKLRKGISKFNDRELDCVEDWAFFLSKELARGIDPTTLSVENVNALKYFRIDPFNHSTWEIHLGGCNGSGDSCTANR